MEQSAAPARTGAAIDRLLEATPSLAADLDDDAFRDALIAVVAASRSLTRLLEQDPAALDVLRHLPRPTKIEHGSVEELVETKQRELLRIAARDLTGQDRLEETTTALSALATDVLSSACALADADGLAVVGMGKLGGTELNYSSDIDIMFVGEQGADQNRAAVEVMDIARRCFRVDANLRPEGRNGPLVRSVASYVAYWQRWAEPWELQALLKARPAAGDVGTGDAFLDAAQEHLWSQPLGTEALRHLRHLKARAEQEVARQGLTDRELKRAPGGIRDIEFSIQLLQLVHGQLDAELRSPNTLTTLAEMGGGGYIDTDDADELAASYRFLRSVEHRLQLVDEQQVHALPSDQAALDQLGRVLGYRDTPEAAVAAQLVQAVRKRRLAVRSIHERVYFRPLLEAFSQTEARLSPEAAVARLEAFGFTDAKRTQQAVRELTRGLNRSSRLMQQLLPLLLDWLSSSPDPELGLVALRNLLSGTQRVSVVTEAFRESPDAARKLCTLVGTSRLVGDILTHNPNLVERLADAERLRTKPRDELIASGERAVGWRDGVEQRQAALRRWKDRHLLGVAARDLLGYTTEVDVIGADLSTVGMACVELALRSLEPRIPFTAVAMGRFGGHELSYGSDLDVLFCYEGDGTAATEEANRIATGLRRFLHGATPATRIYEIDTGLRPEGRQGPLARSIDGFVQYWSRHAEIWERQAMVRARPVAGDLELGDRLLEALDESVWGTGLTAEEEREIRRLKARIERERMPAGEDPKFHLKLGRGSLSDVEWTVQLLQLRHGVRAQGTWKALASLAEAGHLDADDATVLREAYRYCERTRNRWFLVKSAPSDALPTQLGPLLWLARSLGMTPSELRDEYLRVTRRCRRVVERLFYGQA